jgi:primosomal protein N' (replication factor Y)
MCPDCGYVATCDHCSVTLIHHKAEGVLRCPPLRVRDEGARALPEVSLPGHQMARQRHPADRGDRQGVSPNAKIVRIDADTMQKKNLFRSILADFRWARSTSLSARR